MMYKVSDLMFDCSTWDENNPKKVTGLTGIIFDGEIVDENNRMIACGDIEINMFLDKELAEACDTDVNKIEECIYDLSNNIDSINKNEECIISDL